MPEDYLIRKLKQTPILELRFLFRKDYSDLLSGKIEFNLWLDSHGWTLDEWSKVNREFSVDIP